ncbi:MAG TPA: serine hydrolase domain-containing protein [Microbacteriaceae bacterium]
MPGLEHDAGALRAAITELFAKRVVEGVAPASYFAVFDANGIVFDGGFGQYRRGGDGGPPTRSPTRDTAFRIASCTKSFTAATVLLLRDRGILDLDAPITRFVSAFRPAVPAHAPVAPTVRMLLTMSAGLPTDDPWGDRQEAMTPAELTALLTAGVPFVSVPGTAFEYSNLGYALLGQVIENVTGRDYIEFVTAELLAPLGLTATTFDPLARNDASLATGYRRVGRGQLGDRAAADDDWGALPFSGPGAFSPIGGIVTTARNLSTWARWLGAALDTEVNSPGPLSAASRREMQQISRTIAFSAPEHPDAPSAPSAYGYGFGLFSQTHPQWGQTVFHSGGYPGFSAHMRWNSPSAIGIVAFENAAYAAIGIPATHALDLAIEHIDARVPAPTPWAQTLALQPRVESLIRHWDNRLADEIFSPNVALDVPYADRVAGIRAAIEQVGGLHPESVAQLPEPMGTSPAHRVWYLAAARGRLRVELRLAPTAPALIQTLKVDAEPDAEPDADASA